MTKRGETWRNVAVFCCKTRNPRNSEGGVFSFEFLVMYQEEQRIHCGGPL